LQGDLVTVNDCQNSDLFWALRGGGGGTFGVVVSVTVRTYPEVPTYVAALSVVASSLSDYQSVLKEFHTELTNLNDAGASGYYFMRFGTQSANSSTPSTLQMALLFVNQTDEARVSTLLNPVVETIRNIAGNSSVEYNLFFAPQVKLFIEGSLSGESDETGALLITGSRLISRDFLKTADGPTRLTDALAALAPLAPGSTMTGHIVAGGQVARNLGVVDSALNPAWRKTATHITFGAVWNFNTPMAVQKSIAEQITNVAVPKLKVLEPGAMGAYLNEADANEADWQQTFWGVNYPRLYKMKQKWDPEGLFITRLGVGSEDWDADGLCRV